MLLNSCTQCDKPIEPRPAFCCGACKVAYHRGTVTKSYKVKEVLPIVTPKACKGCTDKSKFCALCDKNKFACIC